MKKSFISSLLMLFCIVLVSATGVEGTWKASVETDYGAWEFTITYEVEGNKLSGTFSSDQGDAQFTDGVIEGKDFKYEIGAEGDSFTHKGSLVSEDEILIKWDHYSYGSGEFTMTRVKED